MKNFATFRNFLLVAVLLLTSAIGNFAQNSNSANTNQSGPVQTTLDKNDVYYVQVGDSLAGLSANQWEQVKAFNPSLRDRPIIPMEGGGVKVIINPGEPIYGLKALGITLGKEPAPAKTPGDKVNDPKGTGNGVGNGTANPAVVETPFYQNPYFWFFWFPLFLILMTLLAAMLYGLFRYLEYGETPGPFFGLTSSPNQSRTTNYFVVGVPADNRPTYYVGANATANFNLGNGNSNYGNGNGYPPADELNVDITALVIERPRRETQQAETANTAEASAEAAEPKTEATATESKNE